MQLERSDSKILERSTVVARMDGQAGKLTRKEAISTIAAELGVEAERIGVVSLKGHAGTTDVVGTFYVYGSEGVKKRKHPRYLEERVLTKEEREKLKQDRKKSATAVPPPEAKK